MVDKIDKSLRKLARKQKETFEKLIEQIVANNFQDLDIVKLKGRNDTFRVRKGSHRIIFQKQDNDKIKIIAFEHRSDNTYR